MLWEYLNKFCTAYLDDILIYSSNIKEHKEHVRLVLAKLREFSIQTDVDKCEFHVTKTKYLGLIISTEGIRMDPAKIEAIKQWDTPTRVREVRSFVGFFNFYRGGNNGSTIAATSETPKPKRKRGRPKKVIADPLSSSDSELSELPSDSKLLSYHLR